MTVAKRRVIDRLRRQERFDQKVAQIGRELETEGDCGAAEIDAALEDHIEDDLLRLMFVTCHPVLSAEARVALGMAYGPAAGLALVDTLTSEPALKDYHLLPSVRGDLLARLGRLQEARAEFERAASLTRNGRERALLLDRAGACADAGDRHG